MEACAKCLQNESDHILSFAGRHQIETTRREAVDHHHDTRSNSGLPPEVCLSPLSGCVNALYLHCSSVTIRLMWPKSARNHRCYDERSTYARKEYIFAPAKTCSTWVHAGGAVVTIWSHRACMSPPKYNACVHTFLLDEDHHDEILQLMFVALRADTP
jgi:hypothetical protein